MYVACTSKIGLNFIIKYCQSDSRYKLFGKNVRENDKGAGFCNEFDVRECVHKV